MPISCPVCNTQNRDTARFCTHCSEPLVQKVFCPFCGTECPSQARFCMNCATPLRGIPAAKTGLLPPDTLLQNRYTIVGRVGHGGMGAVYEAQDTRITGKRWAVKELSDAALGTLKEKQDAINAFQQEAQMLALLDHPNLPVVSDFFSEGGKHYLVMEFIDGETLEDMLEAVPGFFDQAQVLGWVDQICKVLDYLHTQNPPVIFRDLKPGNVMIDSRGVIKLIDFGIARLFKVGKSSDTQAMGTPGYAAPEQYGKGQTDSRSDVYSLGVLLHQLLTRYDPGHTPFNLPPPVNINPAIEDSVADVIQKATETQPLARFQSVLEMQQTLKKRSPVSHITSPVAPVKTAAVTTGPVAGKAAAMAGKTAACGKRPRAATTISWINILSGIDLFGLAAGIGLLKGKKWAWWLSLVRNIAWIVVGLGSFVWAVVDGYFGWCASDGGCYFFEDSAVTLAVLIPVAVFLGICLIYLQREDIKSYYIPGYTERSKTGIKVVGWINILLGWGFGLTVPAGIGLLRGKKWGWWVAAVEGWLFSLIGVAAYIYGFDLADLSEWGFASYRVEDGIWVMLSGATCVLIFSLISVYLGRRDVREYFGVGKP